MRGDENTLETEVTPEEQEPDDAPALPVWQLNRKRDCYQPAMPAASKANLKRVSSVDGLIPSPMNAASDSPAVAPIGAIIPMPIAVAVIRPVAVVVGSVIGVTVVRITAIHIAWSKTNTDAAHSEAEDNDSPTPSMTMPPMAMPDVPMPTMTG